MSSFLGAFCLESVGSNGDQGSAPNVFWSRVITRCSTAAARFGRRLGGRAEFRHGSFLYSSIFKSANTLHVILSTEASLYTFVFEILSLMVLPGSERCLPSEFIRFCESCTAN